MVNIFEYQNCTKGRNSVHLREMLQNYTVGELSDQLYDEHSSVFRDTTIYEKLDSDDGSIPLKQLLTFSKWFIDLSKRQQQNLLPLLMLHKDGEYRTSILRHDNQWFVNGGCVSGVGEWEDWRRYIVQLIVKHLENFEENDAR